VYRHPMLLSREQKVPAGAASSAERFPKGRGPGSYH
jgi:hypothetical protein